MRWDLASEAIETVLRETGLEADAGPWLTQYRDDPARFARRVLGETWWKMQRAVAKALIEHRLVVHRSAKKSGKTRGAGGIVLAFMATGPCRVIALAPTHRQVKDLLWAEVRTLHAMAPQRLPGEMLVQEYRIDADNYALAFATDQPERVQGFHTGVRPIPDYDEDELDEDELALMTPDDLQAIVEDVGDRRLLWLIDEAPGLRPALWPIIDSSLQGPNAYALVMGNPTLAARDPHFFMQLLQPGSGWFRIWTSAVEPPEGADELGADLSFVAPTWLIDQEWVERSKTKWGPESALYYSLVLGIPADTGEAGAHLVTYDLLEAALAAKASNAEDGAHIGADLARDGKDSISFSFLLHGVKRAESTFPTRDLDPLTLTMDLVTKLEAQKARWERMFHVELSEYDDGEGNRRIPWSNVHLDEGGVGGGPVDRLREKGAYVDAVDFGAGQERDWEEMVGWETQFLNRRAELHWVQRRALQEGVLQYPEEFEASWAEACWATYELRQESSKGTLIKIEPKKDIRARYGRSPDVHDADLLALSRVGDNLPEFGRIG